MLEDSHSTPPPAARSKAKRVLRAFASAKVAPFVRGALSRAGLHLIRSRFSHLQLELYQGETRGAPRYVNLGAGSFRHPFWHNVDMPNPFYGDLQHIHIEHDLTSLRPLDIESGTVQVFYCSHVIEHLPNENVAQLMSEAYRCLAPGGVLRITCPDMAVQYNALMRKDPWFWKQPSGWGTHQQDLEQRFLEFIATLLTRPPSQLSSETVRSMATSMDRDDFFDAICAKLPANANEQMPEGHCNWFTTEKVIRMLREAGFADAWESRYMQSVEPKLRSPCHFDFVCPEDSLYVECRK